MCGRRKRVGAIYILAGIGGNLASAIFLPQQIQVGASGALYGLLGVLFSDLVQNWSLLQDPCKNLFSLVVTVAISLAMGLLPQVRARAGIRAQRLRSCCVFASCFRANCSRAVYIVRTCFHSLAVWLLPHA